MSYLRVIPRDLFNESALLKCYGQLYLNLESMDLADRLLHVLPNTGFCIEQNSYDGSLTISNVRLWVKHRRIPLARPLNTRRPYSLYAYPGEDIEIAVFNEDGSFTDEMKELLLGDDT